MIGLLHHADDFGPVFVIDKDLAAEVAFKAMKRRNCGLGNDQHAKNKKVQAGIIEVQLRGLASLQDL